uniref:Phosphatidylinositol-specific phospholipase C X domain-containing protein n=1 Tax=Sphaeramia orbicularis TaxID=375764 RepID=A0A673BNG4_9TELE
IDLQLLILLLFINVSSGGFNDNRILYRSSYNLAWMKSIPDETLISAISIPGTHESLSLKGGIFTKSQVWKLDDQLRVGVRYFDVYVGIWFKHKEHIYVRDSHWMRGQDYTLDEVLKIIFDYLKAYKTETVLLKVSLYKHYKDTVLKMMEKLLEKYKSEIWTELTVPSLKQVRGKIVFLQSDTFTRGAKNEKSLFIVKNKLVDNVEEEVKKMKSRLCDRRIAVTDVITSYFDHAKKLARELNTKINDLVQKNSEDSLNRGCLGVISIDFPSVELIKKIIDLKPCQPASTESGPPSTESGPT